MAYSTTMLPRTNLLAPAEGGTDLYALARRRNPKRSLLFVSRVLAKHLPTDPNAALAVGQLLADLVTQQLTGVARPVDVSVLADPDVVRLRRVSPVAKLGNAPIVVGFAETATGLGAAVAMYLEATALSSTRYPEAGLATICRFDEGHSHATKHTIVHPDARVLAGGAPIILVDDELTTGRTALNLITSLDLARGAPGQYVVAAILDWRNESDEVAFAQYQLRTGSSVDVVSLHRGDSSAMAAPDPEPAMIASSGRLGSGPLTALVIRDCPSSLRWNSGGVDLIVNAADRIATEIERVGPVGAVIGTEEHLFVPILVARRLGVSVQSTTRSPVVVSQSDGYPIRSVSTFVSPQGGVEAFAYNIPIGMNRIALLAAGGDPHLVRDMAQQISAAGGAVPVTICVTGELASAWTRNARIAGIDRVVEVSA